MTQPIGGGPQFTEIQPVVVIGLKDIYDAVLKLQSTVDRLVDQQHDQSKDLTDHEARIRSLEKGRWPLPALAAITGIAALIVAVFSAWAGR